MDAEEDDSKGDAIFKLRARDVLGHPLARDGLLDVCVRRSLFWQMAVLTDGVMGLHHIEETIKSPSSVFSGLRDGFREKDPHGFGGMSYFGYTGKPAAAVGSWPPNGKIFEVVIGFNMEIINFRLKECHATRAGCPKGYEVDFPISSRPYWIYEG